MKLVNDWERPRIEFLGASEGKRGQSVHLSQRELATLKNALEILTQLRAYTGFSMGWVTNAEAFLWELLDSYPDGIFRVDTEQLRQPALEDTKGENK